VGQLKPKARGKLLLSHWFPAVKGPRGCFTSSITIIWGKRCAGAGDIGLGHATGGLQRHGDGYVLAAHGVSPLGPSVQRQGRALRVLGHSQAAERLKDDPYRSLAGEVRKAGGYAKDAAPYAEFLWADFFRPLFRKSDLRSSGGQGLPESLVTEAVALARNPKAQFLPGWSGVTSNLHKPL
jgi:hypothetical protein